MSDGSQPKIRTVDTRTAEQKSISSYLEQTLRGRMFMTPPKGTKMDLTGMGDAWTKGVMNPMMSAFQTYAVPEINSSFRRGGLFSKSRGDAISRSLGTMMGGLGTDLANRNWQASLMQEQSMQRPFYESPAGIKEALAFMGTPGLESVGIQGQAGSDWAGAGATIAAKAMFACIPEGSLIDTPKGPVKVEDIRAGDMIMGKEGKPVTVRMKYEFDELPTIDRFIELTFKNNIKVTVCDKHKIDGIRAEDMEVDGFILESKKFVPSSSRSYDLLTSGYDGGYVINGIGIDSMIPELHAKTRKMIKES